MLFVNAHLIPSVTDVTIKPGYRSDHCIVAIKLQTTDKEKGPGIWKLNDSVLRETEYIDIINTTINNTVYEYSLPVYNEEYVTNSNNYSSIQLTIKDSLFYETLLMLIRGETVKYCKRKARNRRIKETELLNNIQIAHETFNINKCEVNAHALQNAQEALE